MSNINDIISDLERDWNSSWVPDLNGIEEPLNLWKSFLNENQRDAEDRDLFARVCALKDRVDHSYTKMLIQIFRPLGEKFIKINDRIPRLFLPSSFFVHKRYSLTYYVPIAGALLLGSYLSSTWRYAVLTSLSTFIFRQTLYRKLPKFDLSYTLHPLLYVGVGPALEELNFRGILQNTVTWMTGSPVTGITLSATLFGALHLIHYPKTHAASCTLNGILYGILNHKLGLPAAIIAHACHNLLATVTSPPWRS